MMDTETKYNIVLLYLRKQKGIADIISEYNISRSVFFKWLDKFLRAGKKALKSNRPGRKRQQPIPEKILYSIINIRYEKPSGSSYTVSKNLKKQGIHINPKKIQRVWKLYGLIERKQIAPCEKRQIPSFTQQEKNICIEYMRNHSHLGSYRTCWDVMNLYNIQCSPMSMRRWREVFRPIKHKEKPIWIFYERKHPHSLWHGDFLAIDRDKNGYFFYQFALLDDYSRAYVGCGIFDFICFEEVLKVLIAAIRKWKVIPKMILVDNDRCFHSRPFRSFCDHLGIQLIHSMPYHPQTNGKIERAHRDDLQDFYTFHRGETIEQLCKKLPEYLYYRNYVRGHWALQGKPAITRLQEYQSVIEKGSSIKAPNGKYILLDTLEKYTEAVLDTRIVNNDGYIKLENQLLRVGVKYRGKEAQIVSNLNGPKIYIDGNPHWWLLNLISNSQNGYEFRYNNAFPVCISKKDNFKLPTLNLKHLPQNVY